MKNFSDKSKSKQLRLSDFDQCHLLINLFKYAKMGFFMLCQCERHVWRVKSSMALRSVRFDVRLQKLSNVGQSWDGWLKIYYLELLRASVGTLSRPGYIYSR
jgi:hypothetical protein